MKAHIHEILGTNFPWPTTHPEPSVSSLCLLRQVSQALSRNCRNEPRPDVDGAWFVAVNFMAGKLHRFSDVNTEIQDCSRVAG
jgi:hypothetical protein